MESEISAVNTERVRIPNKTDATLTLDFSNDKITAATTKEDANETMVMNGVNALKIVRSDRRVFSTPSSHRPHPNWNDC